MVDPDFNLVTLLCHFDGLNGATTTQDSSIYNRPLTMLAGATLSNTRPKFGATSLSVNGSATGMVTAPNAASLLFGAGDFTVEGFVSFNTTAPVEAAICGVWGSVNTDTSWFLFITGGKLTFRFAQQGAPTITHDVAVYWSPAANQEYHVAVSRTGSDFRIFIDGVLASKTINSASINAGSGLFGMGNIPGFTGFGLGLNGYLDEWRITNGLSRYPSDASFAVPSEPYPDSGFEPSVVSPIAGALILTGALPEIIADILVSPGAGRLLVYGGPVEVLTSTIVDAGAGALILTGRPAAISIGTTVSPGHGSLVITGGEPLIYTVSGAVSSQIAMLAVSDVVPNAVSSQIAALALAEPPPPPTRSSQVALMAVAEVVPDVCASQVAIMVLAHSTQCVTQDCQIWTITRRDGEVFRYTSLDRNVTYGGKIYKACGSMDPSAAQNGATLGDTGSISLSGLITDDGISEAELFGGLFDDAFVTIELVSWGDLTQPARRLASGWVGKVSHGPAFHTMEVLSVGARLEQVALVQVVSPSCRWKFGSPQCGVDVEAMKITGSVSRVINRGDIILMVTPPADDGRIWLNGRLRFVDGPCAGIVAEFKSIDFATGQIILWTPAGLSPLPGDAVEILPGCDLTKDGGCKAYSNIINFGGFPDVPGADAILEAPDAKM